MYYREREKMDSLVGEIKLEKGFLEGVEKKVFRTSDTSWVSESYVKTLEEEFGKMITITRDALKLASISREELKKIKEEKSDLRIKDNV